MFLVNRGPVGNPDVSFVCFVLVLQLVYHQSRTQSVHYLMNPAGVVHKIMNLETKNNLETSFYRP